MIGVPPRLVATMALRSKVGRPQLRSWHEEVSAKLSSRNLHVVSYNVDGVETERGLTHDIQRDAFAKGMSHAWTFRHPCDNQPPLILKVPLLANRKPCIMSSDGKHAKKNSRGSAISGARVLAMGRYLIHYSQLATLAQGEDSPLMKSDIIGVDKQDDRAAARLFSSATVDYARVVMPDELGLASYLFIVGEVLDAQQNRHLGHCERVKMLWRARFFLDGWRQHILDHPHYTAPTHFITRELYDILSIFINAMLCLILTHRDFFPDVPLFHWLNSTEPCEHFFGCARKIQKDFTFVEWLIMLPKIAILMAGELRNKMKGAQEKASASRYGYHHSYFHSRGVNLSNLASFPSDDEFQLMIDVAHEEAQNLLTLLGIEVAASAVVDEEALTAALEFLSNDPPSEPAAGEGDQSVADMLEQLLREDGGQYRRHEDPVGTDEPLTDLGIQSIATIIHDHLRL